MFLFGCAGADRDTHSISAMSDVDWVSGNNNMVFSKHLSFKEIVQGRDSSVRVTEDGLLFAVDLVMVVTGLARDQAGLALRRVTAEIFQPSKLIERRVCKHGGRPTKLIGFQDAIELIMVLPGKAAKLHRVQFAEIIKRYLAGDQSMVVEIQANAESHEPIAEIARRSLLTDNVDEDADMEDECPMVDHDGRLIKNVDEAHIEFKERLADVEMKMVDSRSHDMDTRFKGVELIEKGVELYRSLCRQDDELNEQERGMLKQCVLNAMQWRSIGLGGAGFDV